ncbi:hypothetical protein IMG5_114800 [Ichthyophthirius multifiliis]|uniref:Uncharacterized protein n=1 Tax=Ichthyophthirius multifiliis TaxID=5932 RepID=G0QU46_ICHMU|nr:hypothetical protein IMG5_114800 [Ichthyophthirius multifiliis]EGR31270.1 hypothetical protein IMG5_114800 [Ichthyophthirius multifiliis]|eukprot:XP_004034756.1 hypothetical protein IMG5_114800 [Ichthyophthirius multifiliis]
MNNQIILIKKKLLLKQFNLKKKLYLKKLLSQVFCLNEENISKNGKNFTVFQQKIIYTFLKNKMIISLVVIQEQKIAKFLKFQKKKVALKMLLQLIVGMISFIQHVKKQKTQKSGQKQYKKYTNNKIKKISKQNNSNKIFKVNNRHRRNNKQIQMKYYVIQNFQYMI